MDNKKIGLFIADLRKAKNMTQKALADKLYVSDKAVSKWERGICMPDIALMEKLASILDVSVSDILKGEKIDKITKESSDKIVKDSVSFFQKDYFKKKIVKMVISLAILLVFGYLIIMIIGEFNNGKISWGIWGNESSIEVPTFTLIKAKANTKKYLKAIQNYDYDTIQIMLKENEVKMYNIIVDWLDLKEYTDTLKEIEKEEVKLTEYKRLYCYNSNIYYLTYTCAYDLTFRYQDADYRIVTELTDYNGKISVDGVPSWSKDYSYWLNKKGYIDNYVSIYEIEDKELRDNIEKIFTHY